MSASGIHRWIVWYTSQNVYKLLYERVYVVADSSRSKYVGNVFHGKAAIVSFLADNQVGITNVNKTTDSCTRWDNTSVLRRRVYWSRVVLEKSGSCSMYHILYGLIHPILELSVSSFRNFEIIGLGVKATCIESNKPVFQSLRSKLLKKTRWPYGSIALNLVSGAPRHTVQWSRIA